MKYRLFSLLGAVLFFIGSAKTSAATMLSNLGSPWNEPGTIGDIQTVFSEQQFGMAFVTGASTYRLDSVTFEHFQYAGPLRVQIYRFGPPETGIPPAWPLVLQNEFSNPTIDPRRTQWPGWTSFVTYTPTSTITLEPNSWYMVAATEPPQVLYGIGVLFAPSPSYSFSDGWSLNPYWPEWERMEVYSPGWHPRSSQYSLKLEINATPVPEPCSTTLILTSFAVISYLRRNKSPRVNV